MTGLVITNTYDQLKSLILGLMAIFKAIMKLFTHFHDHS